ncbi:unnamed protein product [Allacma fusca]|uniref:Uncharacterized protein n=1 Tax=Allacma fusca TaxID=39272 RepID=A0A8J2LMI0_9HEXA|nr:unnamed protein product [Allacma fusca]
MEKGRKDEGDSVIKKDTKKHTPNFKLLSLLMTVSPHRIFERIKLGWECGLTEAFRIPQFSPPTKPHF